MREISIVPSQPRHKGRLYGEAWGRLHDLARVPDDLSVRSVVSLSLVQLIEEGWLTRLSEIDTVALNRFSEGLTDTIEPPEAATRIFDALDDVIFSQARTLGSKLLLCDAVLRRLIKWDSLSNGPELWKRLGQEMAMHIRVVRGEAKLPLEDRMRAFRVDLKREHSLLRRWIRSQRQTSMDTDELVALTRHYTEENPDSFRRLRANWTLFESFVRNEPEWLTQRTLTSAAFADAFLAKHTNRSEESLRQSISKMPSPKL